MCSTGESIQNAQTAPARTLEPWVSNLRAQCNILEETIQRAKNSTMFHTYQELRKVNEDSFELHQQGKNILEELEKRLEESKGKANGSKSSSQPDHKHNG